MSLEKLCQAVESGNTSEAEDLTRKLLAEGNDPLQIISALTDTMNKLGELFARLEIFLRLIMGNRVARHLSLSSAVLAPFSAALCLRSLYEVSRIEQRMARLAVFCRNHIKPCISDLPGARSEPARPPALIKVHDRTGEQNRPRHGNMQEKTEIEKKRDCKQKHKNGSYRILRGLAFLEPQRAMDSR